MSKVIAIMSMSLDGFVADRDDGVEEVFRWYFGSGDVEFHAGGADDMTFHVSAPSAAHLRGLWSELGAALTGRRTFDVAQGWGGCHGWGPAFVLTHHVPDGWPRPGSTVHFVTDGLESAVRQAKVAAGGKAVGVHGADTIRQLLDAGLLDELHIDIAAVLLGAGVRLFDHLVAMPAVLGDPRVIAGNGVTHLRYPVRRRSVPRRRPRAATGPPSMRLLRHLLWIDCSAGLLAGTTVLALSAWLGALYAIPRHALVGMGVANLAYGTFSWSLARRARRPRALLVLLIAANAAWAVLCLVAAVRLAGTASGFGLAHLAGEGLFVGTLAALEWHQLERLRNAG